MKIISSVVAATALCSLLLNAQVSLPLGTAAPTVVETGPHHRTWQTVKVALDQRGQQVTPTNSYLELATGMHVSSETEARWVTASDEIELVNAGAVAARTHHKIIFLQNLNDPSQPLDPYLPTDKP